MRNVLYLLLIPFILNSQSTDLKLSFKNDFDAFIKKVYQKMSAQHGLAISVVKDEQMIFESYLGMADFEKNIPVTSETDFYIASSTKSFTALATIILAEQGKINLNRSLASYFPEINFPSELKTDSVTIYNLLTHTSGLENMPLVILTAYTGNHDLAKRIRVFSQFTEVNTKHPLHQFQYTNFGYVVTSIILERELHKPWQDILAETVFQPAGMAQTSAYISDAAKHNWSLAKPYTQRNRENKLERIALEKKDNTMHAAGGIISTARDLARFLIAELNHGQINSKQVFPAELIDRAQEAQTRQDREYFNLHRFAYGYGWNLATVPSGDTLIHHYGGYPGAHAQVAFMPQYNIGVAVMTNENNQGQDLAYLLASYAFDYLSGKADIDPVYSERLDSTIAQNERWLKGVLNHEDDRAKRTWQLELPFSAYKGFYENDPMGTLVVSNPSDSVLIAKLYNLKSPPAEPFTKPNSIRVEMIPGSGSVLQFDVSNNKVVGATLNGMVFTKKD